MFQVPHWPNFDFSMIFRGSNPLAVYRLQYINFYRFYWGKQESPPSAPIIDTLMLSQISRLIQYQQKWYFEIVSLLERFYILSWWILYNHIYHADLTDYIGIQESWSHAMAYKHIYFSPFVKISRFPPQYTNKIRKNDCMTFKMLNLWLPKKRRMRSLDTLIPDRVGPMCLWDNCIRYRWV